MNKTEIIEKLKNLVSEVENKDTFIENHEIKDSDYYAYSQTYILAWLKNIIIKGER